MIPAVAGFKQSQDLICCARRERPLSVLVLSEKFHPAGIRIGRQNHRMIGVGA
jgi:hypothetical protein